MTEEQGLTLVRKHVTIMTDRLTIHLGWICEQPWVPDFEQEILELLRTTQRITMTEPRRELLKGVMWPSWAGTWTAPGDKELTLSLARGAAQAAPGGGVSEFPEPSPRTRRTSTSWAPASGAAARARR
ncbi:hypothetical protein [Streptomyces chartreusis]